eukprot:CAMPEP_0204829248 /NCGR_PEP_ID=MMETSP1346-20131115/7339_1 /ASSEMBLY_ACC=CAM_ASM_000771 /TAXON_ID=215587 /ORGANISM="Aplanochytrium stocchinoi, Strain GSBS06" /LENGTH=319 /DNA_ID=CAMNT_0051958881 /DNA_START=225 /DNA_END=1185 /DNA_ORIENTATION=-
MGSESYGTTTQYTSPETAAYYFAPDYFDTSIFQIFNVKDSVANDIGKTDMWSLAVTLLEVYTGTTPFTYRTGFRGGEGEIKAEILKYYTNYSKMDHDDSECPTSLYTYMKAKDYKNREVLPQHEYSSPTTLLFYKHMRERIEEKMSVWVNSFEAEGRGFWHGRKWTTFQAFVTECLMFDYKLRPSALTAINHSFFSDYTEPQGRGFLLGLLDRLEVPKRGNGPTESSEYRELEIVPSQNEREMETDELTHRREMEMIITDNSIVPAATPSQIDKPDDLALASLKGLSFSIGLDQLYIEPEGLVENNRSPDLVVHEQFSE